MLSCLWLTLCSGPLSLDVVVAVVLVAVVVAIVAVVPGQRQQKKFTTTMAITSTLQQEQQLQRPFWKCCNVFCCCFVLFVADCFYISSSCLLVAKRHVLRSLSDERRRFRFGCVLVFWEIKKNRMTNSNNNNNGTSTEGPSLIICNKARRGQARPGRPSVVCFYLWQMFKTLKV